MAKVASTTFEIDAKALNTLKLMAKAADKLSGSVAGSNGKLKNMQGQISRTSSTVSSLDKSVSRVGGSFGKLQSKVERASAAVSRMGSRASTAFSSVRKHVDKVGSGIGSITSKVFSLQTALIGLATGAAMKVGYDKTIGSYMDFEQAQAMIYGTFGMKNKKQADTYMNWAETYALTSPVLNSQEMIQGSSSYLAETRDMKQLAQMWDITERLIAKNPFQGVEGAVFSMRELLSGDAVSMADRFDFGKKDLNRIKDLPMQKKLDGMIKLLESKGITRETVDLVAGTSRGLMNQIDETLGKSFKIMGKPAVDKVIRPWLQGFQDALTDERMAPYVKFGQQMLTGMSEAFTELASGAGKWIDGIINNPAFANLPTMGEKFYFVLTSIRDSFSNWLSNGGSETIQNMVSGMIKVVVQGIEDNMPAIISIGTGIGKGLAMGALDGLKGAIGGPLQGLLGTDGAEFKNAANFSDKLQAHAAANGSNTPMIKPTSEMKDISEYRSPSLWDKTKDFFGFAVGSRRIPRDMPAMLHEGEEVRTKREVNAEKSRSANDMPIINIQSMTVREEADIQKVAAEFVRQYKMAITAAGG
ncbi:hypothetical protein M5X02_29280 [Paenibacillus alvei]|uniref:hypothetical protein n=1 Tax=Paenibacillus alvei TaxID=44250 RepID=UPI00028924F8|nr:hypothetical protein [Paenibacillus alvei]EJW14860.1 hypothetical protein PAV_11c02010 [Paenibacillus alvei DSM 29]MCY9544725.1 hypothetical protein [Paenibacillus alvei]MCY9708379.1 hypothetical protein [Paenibacillus alvei]MEC0083263.1 hypothetical protein [Paenibacillus alvei]